MLGLSTHPSNGGSCQDDTLFLGCGCIIMLGMMATGASAQDPNSLPDNKILPPQNSHVGIVTPAMLYQQETI